MTAFEEALLAVKLAALAGLALGLIVRGGARVAWTFLLYSLGVLLSDSVYVLHPEWFVWDAWLAFELLHAVLKFLLAAEVGWRIFAALPGARATLAIGLLFVCLLMLRAVLGAPLGASADVVARTALPIVLHGTAWIFGGLLAAKLYYRIPVHPLHQAILRGFVPFLMTFTVCLGLLETFGWDVRLPAGYAFAFSYLLLLGYWNRAVWRSTAPPDVQKEVVQILQPWRRI